MVASSLSSTHWPAASIGYTIHSLTVDSSSMATKRTIHVSKILIVVFLRFVQITAIVLI